MTRNALVEKVCERLLEVASVSYTAVVLDRRSHEALLSLVPEGWDSSKTCHHCTLNMGPWKGDPSLLGTEVELEVVGFAADEKVAAVAVNLNPSLSTKAPPHVTVAVTGGGKPFQAGKLDFSSGALQQVTPKKLRGVVKEVGDGDYSLAESLLSRNVTG